MLDYMKWPEVLGTVGGDDTIFIAVDTAEHTSVFVERLKSIH
jgi:transcriptional regulator of arginine metabolism